MLRGCFVSKEQMEPESRHDEPKRGFCGDLEVGLATLAQQESRPKEPWLCREGVSPGTRTGITWQGRG